MANELFVEIVETAYETEGGRYITPCPKRSGVKAGGIECAFLCRRFVSEDRAKKVIVCDQWAGRDFR